MAEHMELLGADYCEHAVFHPGVGVTRYLFMVVFGFLHAGIQFTMKFAPNISVFLFSALNGLLSGFLRQ